MKRTPRSDIYSRLYAHSCSADGGLYNTVHNVHASDVVKGSDEQNNELSGNFLRTKT